MQNLQMNRKILVTSFIYFEQNVQIKLDENKMEKHYC